MFFAIFLLCLAGIPFSRCKQLHEYMTPDEVMAVFHKPHHLVPEYEVVPVLHRVARDENSKVNGSELKLKVFNDDVRLYLNPTDGILATKNTPVWTASSDPRASEGLQYKQIPRAMKTVGVPLQDVRSSSAVLATPTYNGLLHLDGVLNNSIVIKSLPRRILDRVLYGGHNLYEPHHTKNVTDDEDFAYTHHHVVYKMPPSDQYKDFKITEPESDQKRSSPDIIYPEFLIVADYSVYQLLGGNLEQAVKYLVAFWNGVDLRYRLLTTPKIRFNIAGIIIGVDKDATPYLENSRYEISSVDADLALRGMADYFYRESRFPTDFYDMAIALTHLDMCNMVTDDFCDTSTLGYAYVAGACDRNATKQSSEAVGIVEDNGGFAGIIPTAHEIGHLIGARHDGNPKGAGDCPPYDGFIMTNGLMLHDNGFEWSQCSINAFYNFINEERAKCLYNEPVSGRQIKRVLPGSLMSLDEQCSQVFGTTACNKDATACTRLECAYPGFEGYCRATAPAAEGSPCGDDLLEWQMRVGRNNPQRQRKEEITEEIFTEIRSSIDQKDSVVAKAERETDGETKEETEVFLVRININVVEDTIHTDTSIATLYIVAFNGVPYKYKNKTKGYILYTSQDIFHILLRVYYILSEIFQSFVHSSLCMKIHKLHMHV